MKRKDWFIKYSLEFIVIVLGISVSFWLNQVSTNKQNNNERIKVLNSLQNEAQEINDYCAERKINWQKDIAIGECLMPIAQYPMATARCPIRWACLKRFEETTTRF